MHRTWALIVCGGLIVSALIPRAYPQATSDPWGGLAFLAGDWIGEGGGGPGQGTGEFSFEFDLQRHILVRRNRADYPASNGQSASRHDDLMVIYAARPGQPVEAVYFDSEGQVIRYERDTVSEGSVLRLVSRAQADTPRYRLTYRKTGTDTLEGEFEIAPPGKPEAFASYLTWKARRK